MNGVVIIDYGMGNLRSVQKAFEHLGTPAEISSDAAVLSQAGGLVLPGVGAFRDAIAALQRHDLKGPIRDFIASGRPFLGICLGQQLLLDVSYEDGEYEGLGIVAGAVRRFELAPEFKIPHMGWNQLTATASGSRHPLLQNLPPDAWYYFVHSYFVDPQDHNWVLAEADYGQPFAAVIGQGNVMATQFHPEKSQTAGLQLLRNFADLTGVAPLTANAARSTMETRHA